MQPTTNLAEYLDFDAAKYLEQYWPECASDSVAWQDNVSLMNAYQESALAIRRIFDGHTGLNLLDVGTGPALAPLLAFISEIASAQLSDFHPQNRQAVVEMPINYWRSYVSMLTKLYDQPLAQEAEILDKLDRLRRQKPVLPVDLFSDQPFGRSLSSNDYQVVTMNFVADGITTDAITYFQILDRVLHLVQKGCVFSMSAIVDSSFWKLGETKHPSPRLSEYQVIRHVESAGMQIEQLTRSSHVDGQTYDGNWIVLTARRI